MTNFASKAQRICTANDKNGLSAAGVGDLPVIFTDQDDGEHPVTLKNVLWAPQAISSLLSISQAVRGGCTHGIDEDGAWLCLPLPNNDYIWAEEEQGLYILDAKLQLASPAVISLSTDTTKRTRKPPTEEQIMTLAMQIHASLGHLHWVAVKKLLKAGAISQLSKVSDSLLRALLSLSTLPCRACDLSKKTLKSLPRTTLPPTLPSLPAQRRPWQLVFADSCGPFSRQEGGNKHITMFIEALTSGAFIFERYSLTGEVSAEYVAIMDNMSRKTSNGIGNLRTDEGTDWKSSAVAEVCQDRGIHHQYALVDAHGQIGQVESRFRFYVECADAMLRQSGAPLKFKFRAIKFVNYIQNHVVRGATSRLNDLMGVQSAVTFYPFWCLVTAVAPRRKQGDLGTGKSYRLVGYSSHHKGGYELWNADTDRVVVRGDVHSLNFFPEDTTTHTDTHTQAQEDDASSGTAITYEEGGGIQGRYRSTSEPFGDQSLSLSRISQVDDSHSGSLNVSFDSGSGNVSDPTPAMREGNTDDTMSDSAVFRRPARRVSEREQWVTASDFGSSSV